MQMQSLEVHLFWLRQNGKTNEAVDYSMVALDDITENTMLELLSKADC